MKSPRHIVRTHCRTQPSSSAFTLIEVLIVLAIIAVLAALSWPSMMRFAKDQRVREWTTEVRNELAGSRYKAITNSLVYQFRYEPGGRWFAVLPYDQPDSGNSEDPNAGQGEFARKVSTAPPVVLKELPKGLTFRMKDGQPTETLAPVWQRLLPQGESLGRVAWSVPILFHVDGSAENATLFVEDEHGNFQEISLRGLTGGVKVSSLVRGGSKR